MKVEYIYDPLHGPIRLDDPLNKIIKTETITATVPISPFLSKLFFLILNFLKFNIPSMCGFIKYK